MGLEEDKKDHGNLIKPDSIKLLIMSEELGVSFIQYFYQCFDGNLSALAGIYVCLLLSL